MSAEKNTDVDYLVTVLKHGMYEGGDIMRAWCKLRDQQARIRELEYAIRKHRDQVAPNVLGAIDEILHSVLKDGDECDLTRPKAEGD